MTHKYTIGLDFGTDSVRALLVNASDGSEISSYACDYPRWKKGLYSDPVKSQYRQHPLDYLEAMEVVLKEVVAECPDKAAIAGISVDTTGSSPCLCDRTLTPLSLKEAHAEDPAAMFVIWKDHTGEKECEEIVSHCQGENAKYLAHTGFAYSPENYWPKILHLVRTAPHLLPEAYTAVEFCDWIPAVLTGCQAAKSRS